MGAKAALTLPGTAGKLDGESFSHEIRSVEGRDDISSIHRILVLDEAKAVHKLDFSDISGTMSRKMGLNIGLGSIARKVPQVEPGGRYLRHVARREVIDDIKSVPVRGRGQGQAGSRWMEFELSG